MSRRVGRVLALCCVLLTVPAFAQQLTDKQVKLIKQLPSPVAVIAQVPVQEDAFKTSALQMHVLIAFHELAESISPVVPGEYRPLVNQYWQTYLGMRTDLLKQMGAWGKGDKAIQDADGKILDAARSNFNSQREAWRERRKMFADVLEGDLRGYALRWHDEQVRSSSGQKPNELLHNAPQVVIDTWERMLSLPDTFWLGLLGAWIILGIVFRVMPFQLVPDKLSLLQSGRQKRGMHYHAGTVIAMKAEAGNVAKVILRSSEGDHESIVPTDDIDVRLGHRIMGVFDKQKRMYLFFHNFDTQQYAFQKFLRTFVKMRPRILIPVWLLTMYGAYTYEPEPLAWLTYAVYGTPFAYLFIMGMLNSRRVAVFKNEMAPLIVAATPMPAPVAPAITSAPDYIGTADFGLSPS